MPDDKSQLSLGAVVDIPLGWKIPSVRRESEITEMAEVQVAHSMDIRMETENRIIIDAFEGK